MQNVVLKAEFSFETATMLIKHYSDTGWTVSATQTGKTWEIAAWRGIDPELERRAEQALHNSGLIAPTIGGRSD